MDFNQLKPLHSCNPKTKTQILGCSIVHGNVQEVVVTTSDELFVYNASIDECIMNWAYRPQSSQAISVPAVKHKKGNRLFAVQGERRSVLMTWKQTQADLKQATTKTLNNMPIHQLFAHKAIGNAVLCVFDDGRFNIYGETLNDIITPAAFNALKMSDSSNRTVWAQVLSNSVTPTYQSIFVCIVTKNSDNEHHCRIFEVAVENQKKVSSTLVASEALEAPIEGALIQTCAFHTTKSQLSLFWSSGEWQKVFLKRSSTGDFVKVQTELVMKFEQNSEEAVATRSSKRRKTTTKTKAPTSTLSTIAAITIGTSNQVVVGQTCDTSSSVFAWNSAFDVELDRREFDSSTIDLGKLKDVQSSAKGELNVFVFERSIMTILLGKTQSTLASVLGVGSKSSAACLPPLSVTADLGNKITSLKDGAVDSEEWQHDLKSQNKDEEADIENLTDAKVTNTRKKFLAAFNKSVAKHKSNDELSFRFVVEVARRCVESSDLELWQPLQVLIESKRLSERSVPKLLPLLMKCDQFQLLEECLANLNDIPEAMYVRLIRYFVRKYEDVGLTLFMESKELEATTWIKFNPVEYFLAMIIAQSKNDVFLQNAMRTLSLEEVLTLLTFLKKLYYTLGHDTKDLKMLVLPSEAQVLDWIAMLLDLHYQSLVLNSESHDAIVKLLTELNDMVSLHISSCVEMSRVHGRIRHLISGVALPAAPIPDYSVEVLYL